MEQARSLCRDNGYGFVQRHENGSALCVVFTLIEPFFLPNDTIHPSVHQCTQRSCRFFILEGDTNYVVTRCETE